MSCLDSLFRRFFIILLLITSSTQLVAQMNPNVHMVDMSHFLPYILPFYALTLFSLALLIHKIIRKQSSMMWVYVLCVASIVGALLLSTQLHQFSEEVLHMDANTGSEHIGQGTFWRIATPNIIIGILALVMQRVHSKKE